jgi:hypothetical protein
VTKYAYKNEKNAVNAILDTVVDTDFIIHVKGVIIHVKKIIMQLILYK